MKDAIVYVLISIHTYGGHLVKEYQSTFARQDVCVAVMQEINRATADHPWYCERHIVE